MLHIYKCSPLSSRDGDDGGFSLVEMVVAVMVFALVSLGVAYSMLAVLSSTRDTRGRQVAANLAAEEIDRVRSVGNIFDLKDAIPRTKTIDNVVYTVRRDTLWYNSAGGEDPCGAGSGNLQYVVVNVSVAWSGMNGSTSVSADTVVAPTSKINDPAFGTIAVRVTDSAGAGVQGATVAAAPAAEPGTALSIEGSIAPTDKDGCAFVLKAAPGNYDVTVSKTGYVDVEQETAPVVTVKVTAGTATSALITYDVAAKVTLSYAAPGVTGTVSVPSNLRSSLLSTFGIASVSAGSNRLLFPFSSGYIPYVGALAGAPTAAPACKSIDPTLWPAGTDGTTPIGGVAPEVIAVQPGASSTVVLPVGAVRISNTTSSAWSGLRAERMTPPSGSPDPGCALSPSEVLTLANVPQSSNLTVLLPHGTWKITRAASSTTRTTVTSVVTLTRGTATSGVITLDPRTPVAP